MSDLATTPPSSSMGDYVKAIWELGGGTGTASTKEISGRLSVAPASVTNMLGRLREKGYVDYERYRGASLTEEGRAEALRLVRRHRLIETFLLEHLGYSWQDVHEEAERMEHVVSDDFTERLADFLGHPGRDPHGAPIPTADGAMASEDSFPLGEAAGGEKVRIVRVNHEGAPCCPISGSAVSYRGGLSWSRRCAPSTASSQSRTKTASRTRWGSAGRYDPRSGPGGGWRDGFG
ncbi:metal-dependent transcriptional regulator [Rubrobacter marinus]|uniref:Manganese transport regulator n=1 Tax=Rubrobacter marinus TaxID=2653852 RepID=A0A6G8Q1N8_9ACTN|nr:metal-dependent transcriptional regulator [Rubrobacter marinus]QIN80383.1 metal-dependent transcriptional regulator [Rubrobacter marinus]